MTPLVMKFGGTSVADAACLRRVAALVEAELPRAPLVVLSAAAKTTDALFSAARAASAGDVAAALDVFEGVAARHRGIARDLDLHGDDELTRALEGRFAELEALLRGVALARDLTPVSTDAIVAMGERFSTKLFAALLRRRGTPVALVPAEEVIRTDARHGAAQPIFDEVRRLAEARLGPLLGPGRVVVTQGYVGADDEGRTTTLGRGGSDFSAALLGGALRASEVQIWTDVEGILSADPRVAPAALPVAEMSFAEAAELAAFGAKVLHPATIQPAAENDVPVTVRHTERPQRRITRITRRGGSGRPVTSLASRGPVTVVTAASNRMLNQPGFLARLFAAFGRLGVSVDVVATAEVSVSVTVEADAPLEALAEELRDVATTSFARDRAIVAVVGEQLKRTPGLPARILAAVGDDEVEMVSMGANEINLTLVVRRERAHDVVRRLHRALLEPS
ncbi:MAG TPA: aspartate kinase [Planctomycetota bacterium]|nr:aspartate kinase [Planctomycetota bacterium]